MGRAQRRRRQVEAPAQRRERTPVWRDLALIVGAFVLATALAAAFGAANFGTALAFGQIALALAVVYVILRH
jgi:hypothetical protein